MRLPALIAGLLLSGLIAGCATTGPQFSQDIGALRSGVTATRDQSRIAFTSANKLARDQAISRKLLLPEITLQEQDLAVAVTPEAAAKWDEAFGLLDSYAATLQKLVAPENAQGIGDAVGVLGNQLNTGKTQAGIKPSLVGAFGALATAVTQAKAEKTAIGVMQKTDASFQGVTSGMADAVGKDASQTDSLRFVVDQNWQTARDQISRTYAKVAPTNQTERAKVLKEFAATLDQRDLQNANLDQLYSSLIALGEAHSAAAKGKPGDAQFWIERISGWLDEVKTRTAAAQKALEKAS